MMRLMDESIASSVEFAEFIADVSDPGTGVIRSDRLSRWLGVEEGELIGSWRASGCPEWAAFASQILEILDAFQDLTFSLSRSLAWYCEVPLQNGAGLPAAQYVKAGDVGFALASARQIRRAARRPRSSFEQGHLA